MIIDKVNNISGQFFSNIVKRKAANYIPTIFPILLQDAHKQIINPLSFFGIQAESIEMKLGNATELKIPINENTI